MVDGHLWRILHLVREAMHCTDLPEPHLAARSDQTGPLAATPPAAPAAVAGASARARHMIAQKGDSHPLASACPKSMQRSGPLSLWSRVPARPRARHCGRHKSHVEFGARDLRARPHTIHAPLCRVLLTGSTFS